MIKIALCDDDKHVFDSLRECVASFGIRYNEECKLQFFQSPDELLRAPFDYNILILDIMFSDEIDKIDGISLGKKLRDMGNTAIINMLTSRRDKHSDAIQNTIMRYLIKPIKQDEFDEMMITALNMLKGAKRVLTVSYKQMTHYFDVRDIIYVESYSRKRFVYTQSGKYQTTESWSDLYEQLRTEEFYSPQKFKLVNFAHIESTTKTSILMDNKAEIKLQKGSYDDFNSQFMRFLRAKK